MGGNKIQLRVRGKKGKGRFLLDGNGFLIYL